MSDEDKKCPQGWDEKQLFAFVEGDMDDSAREALEAHLKSCEICASEAESLRKMGFLLKRHSDVFHPDEERLYRYVTASEDPDGGIARHLEACGNCREDVQLLKEMIEERSAAPIKIPAMPHRLSRRIEQLHPAVAPVGIVERLRLAAAGLISAPFRMPRLALGTAAALVVLAIISIPLWQAFKSAHLQGSGVSVQESPAQKAGEGAPLEMNQYRQDLEKDKLMENPERLRAEPHGPTGAPVSPAPSVSLPPDARFEKFDHRMEGSIGAAPGAAPTRLPPAPQAMEERSHGPAMGRTPHPEKEVSARPRASKLATPASPMKRETAKRKYPAEVEEARPEAAPAGVSESRIPVRIRIADAEGRSLPGFQSRLPANLASRYRLAEESESGTSDLIVIRVVKRDGLFDLSAGLFESNSSGASRSLQVSGVPEKDLQDRVTSLISALLEKK